MIHCLRQLLYGLLTLSGFYCQAQSLPPLPADGSFAARGHILFRSDPTGKLTLSDVLQSPAQFTPTLTDIPQFGKGQPPHWFHFRVANERPHAQTFIAEIDFAFLNEVQFFQVDNSQRAVQVSKILGWPTRLTDRTDGHRNPLFDITLRAGQSADIYVRTYVSVDRLSVPIRLWTEAEFRRSDRADRQWWGWINGMFASIVFIGLLLWVLMGDRIYGYYALYTGASWLFLISIEGYWLEWFDRSDYGFISAENFRFLWNQSQALMSYVFLRWYVLTGVFNRPWVRFVYRASLIVSCVNLLLLLISHQFPAAYQQQKIWITPLFTINFFAPVVVFSGLVLWIGFRQASRSTVLGQSARICSWATAPLLLLTAASMLRNYAFIPDHFLLRSEGLSLATLHEFIVLSISLGVRYKRIANDRQRLTEQTHQQQQQAVETQMRLQQQEVRALEAQLRLQAEKERIARDLHDHVGSQLSVIASSLDYPANERTAHQVAAIGAYARDAMQSLRDTIWAIHQEQVTMPEFRIKLQQYVGRQQELVKGCRLVVQGDAHLPQLLNSVQALNLFRIVQEALTNALKYAHASQIIISYQLTEENGLLLSIEDNGVGFCSCPDTERPHYGLLNMQRRAVDLGGHCRIDAEPGRGTGVWVTVPLDTQNTAITV